MKLLALPLAASALALAACSSEPADDTIIVDDTAAVDTMETAGTAPDIVGVAQSDANFSTLVTAIDAADLGGTLSGAGPYTVFAPTNSAFEKLSAGTLDNLTAPENREQLSGILTYHVVSGNMLADALTQAITDGGGSAELTTLNGETLTATLDGEKVILTDATGGTATVTMTDVNAANGTIHAIDTVLMPS
ncbi:fasciclin domain-containing protein [Pseudopontixanthobacter vadosimaris]|uniref:fasciclin domain-containing protein n=1 Tax=Pseudopontixanthobacter vadosimaris TaxID=2726450 RepID=UPI0014740A2F|nr:fasciclin domain-containing protein [Pseudopontixanthobacter vadosimaris]